MPLLVRTGVLLLAGISLAVAGEVMEGIVVPQAFNLCPVIKGDLADLREADLRPLSDAERDQFLAMMAFHQFMLDSGLKDYCLIQLALPDGRRPEIFISRSDHDALFVKPSTEFRGQDLQRRVNLTVEALADGDNRVLKGSDVQFEWVIRRR
jgi:hypothetical protein